MERDLANAAMTYEPNDKHKKPWQPGRKGSLCPSDISPDTRSALLADSEPDPDGGSKRYATDGSRAFCAQPHRPDVFHGYPVGWKEVPEEIRNNWVRADRVKRRTIARYWDRSEGT